MLEQKNIPRLMRRKQFHKLICNSVLVAILLITALVLFSPMLTRGQPTNNNPAQTDNLESRLLSQLQGLNFENNKIYVGIWVIHIYNYQYTTGTYTLDLYTYFFWTDPNITTANWYLTNGYPINSGAKILVTSNNNGTIKYEFYRTTATFNTPPDARDFPFDQITLNITLEVINPGYYINLAWLQNETGVDSNFINPIWKTTNITLSSEAHPYTLGVVAPTAEMSITQERVKQSSAIASLFPPLVFCIVSAISFLFSLKDPPSVGLRLGLNSSMLITTILFELSISNSIPPSTSLSIFGLFTITVILFLALNLVVTIAGFAYFVKFKDANKTIRINRWGLFFSLIIPILLFAVLFLLRT